MTPKRRDDDGKWLRKNYIILCMIFLLAGGLVGSMNWVDAKNEKVVEYVDKQDQEIIQRMDENREMVIKRMDKLEDKMDDQQKLIIQEIKRSR